MCTIHRQGHIHLHCLHIGSCHGPIFAPSNTGRASFIQSSHRSLCRSSICPAMMRSRGGQETRAQAQCDRDELIWKPIRLTLTHYGLLKWSRTHPRSLPNWLYLLLNTHPSVCTYLTFPVERKSGTFESPPDRMSFVLMNIHPHCPARHHGSIGVHSLSALWTISIL